jgi:hypothetical protein
MSPGRRLDSSLLQNNPLHISLFPAEDRAPLEYQLLLSSCLDIFEARLPHKTLDQDFGLLQAVEGRPATAQDSKSATAVGLRDSDLKPVSKM